jgi:hypothetical protein
LWNGAPITFPGTIPLGLHGGTSRTPVVLLSPDRITLAVVLVLVLVVPTAASLIPMMWWSALASEPGCMPTHHAALYG